MRPYSFFCTGLCDLLKAANKLGEFQVYRQEVDHDFVQAGPLVDTFFCFSQEQFSDLGPPFTSERLDDPWVFLIHPEPAFIFPAAIRPEVAGPRLVYADNYPCKKGTKVRYVVQQVDPVTGEGISLHYSNVLEIP